MRKIIVSLILLFSLVTPALSAPPGFTDSDELIRVILGSDTAPLGWGFNDDNFEIWDTTNKTKRGRFELGSISGQKTWTFQNNNYTLAGTDINQVFTGNNRHTGYTAFGDAAIPTAYRIAGAATTTSLTDTEGFISFGMVKDHGSGTMTANNNSGINFFVRVDGSGDASSGSALGIVSEAYTNKTAGTLGSMYCGGFGLYNSNAGTLSLGGGFSTIGITTSTGNINEFRGYWCRSPAQSSTGKIVTNYGIDISNQGYSGMTTSTALNIANQTGATNSWVLYSDGGPSYHKGKLKTDTAPQIDIASATTNYVWTATDADGNGVWAAAPGAGGGDVITVNTSGVSDADFDDTTPSAPSGSVNVKWQKDGSTPANVSAYVTVSDILSVAYPVGAIYISTLSTNPNTLLGFGTWSAFGTGRVLVSLDSGQTEFDVVEETGGAKTHTLTTAEIPAHSHVENAPTTASGGTMKFGIDTNASGTQGADISTASEGGGGAHNNLQPYIVVYMWKRTS